MSPLVQQVLEGERHRPLTPHPRNRPFPKAQGRDSTFLEACHSPTCWHSCGRPLVADGVVYLLLFWAIAQPWETRLRDLGQRHPPGKARGTGSSGSERGLNQLHCSRSTQEANRKLRDQRLQGQLVWGRRRPEPVGGAKRSEPLMPLAGGRGLPAIIDLHWLLEWRPRPSPSNSLGSQRCFADLS